jgi:hypothetical protein
MKTDKTAPISQNKETQVIATDEELERAIETLQCFTKPNESENLPSLEHFQLQDNGALEVRKLSTLEKTLAYVMGVRKEKTEQLKAIKGRVLRSVDIIKIALMRLQAGSQVDETLEKRLLIVIQRYNDIMRQAKKEPKSFTDKLKYFFLKSSGFEIDKEVQQHEIQLPARNFYDSSAAPAPQSGLLAHKFTLRTIEATSQKITTFVNVVQGATLDTPQETAELPQKQEVELFRMKAFTLLNKQEALHPHALADALDRLRKSPIEVTENDLSHANIQISSDSIISLRQTICPFPGEEIELKGAFTRASAMSIPIKDSFRVSAKAFQTGFPDPLQSIGFTFSEKFLPHYLLRAYLIPEVDYILKKKQEIAEKLLPKGSLNAKAKALLQSRKNIFRAHKKTLLQELKKLMQKLFSQKHEKALVDDLFSLLEKKENFFEELSFIHVMTIKSCIERPFQSLQQKLFSLKITDSKTLQSLCKELIDNELEKLCSEVEKATLPQEIAELKYKELFAKFLAEHAPVLFTQILSEQLGFEPPKLSSLQKKIVATVFYQQKAFIQELEEINPQDENVDEKLLQSILGHIQKQAALFSDKEPILEEVDALERYYFERFTSNNQS